MGGWLLWVNVIANGIHNRRTRSGRIVVELEECARQRYVQISHDDVSGSRWLLFALVAYAGSREDTRRHSRFA